MRHHRAGIGCVCSMLWKEGLAVIRAMKEARGDEADDGISLLWWGIACIVSGAMWLVNLMVFG